MRLPLRSAIFAATFLLCTTVFGQSVTEEKPDFTLAELDVRTLQQALRDKQVTAVEVVNYYLQRIEAHNDDLHAVIATNPFAVKQAEAADKIMKRGQTMGPLHGIPVLLKDNIETKEGLLPTTAGSIALQNNITKRDAFITEKLRRAGAIILGKANLSEWANFRSTRSSSGWSGMGGQTRNAYNTNKSPCGSSSGSGVAVAADLTLLAVGTETDGSVTCPSSINGIVGIKPTIGLVSRSGIVPISHRQDTAGPMTRTVYDAALMLSLMAAYDSTDAPMLAARENGSLVTDYTANLNITALMGKRIGVLSNMAGFHEGVTPVFARALGDLKKAGATLVEDLRYPDSEVFADNAYGNLLRYDFKHDLNTYLAGLPTALEVPRSLAALIEINQQHANSEMQWFGQELFIQSEEKGDLSDDYYVTTVKKVTDVARAGIDDLLKEHNLDALIAPTTGVAWSIDRINGDNYVGPGSSSYPAIAGYPNITVPMGYLHGLPIGLSFISTAFTEAELLPLAYAYEQATLHRKPPALD